MARVEGLCTCTNEDCETHETVARKGWVDKLSGLCRKCESTCAKGLNARWGTKVL